MTISQAINLAIENGWNSPDIYHDEGLGNNEICYGILLDKDFWVALGKGLSWKKEIGCELCGEGINEIEGWKVKWHDFIKELSWGGSIASWFEGLK